MKQGSYEIRRIGGHYEMYVDGKFYSSYDSFTDAVNDLENLRSQKEGAA